MNVKDSYPLPRIDECIDLLGEDSIFSTLDPFNGNWQFDIAIEDRHKTSLGCHSGTFQYLRMLFRLTKTPETFQRAPDLILT